MPSLTTIAGKKVADAYRDHGYVPYVVPALELPREDSEADSDDDGACARFLAHMPLASRTPLDYLHMVSVAARESWCSCK